MTMILLPQFLLSTKIIQLFPADKKHMKINLMKAFEARGFVDSSLLILRGKDIEDIDDQHPLI